MPSESCQSAITVKFEIEGLAEMMILSILFAGDAFPIATVTAHPCVGNVIGGEPYTFPSRLVAMRTFALNSGRWIIFSFFQIVLGPDPKDYQSGQNYRESQDEENYRGKDGVSWYRHLYDFGEVTIL